MNLKIVLASAMLILLTAFGDDGIAEKTPQVTNPLFNTGFYSSRSPVELLEDLAILHALNPELNGRINLPILDRPGVQRWLTDERLRELKKLGRDETPCLQVVNALSSFLSAGPSTVGHEARILIEAALDGGYPPLRSSAQSPEQIEAKLDSYLSAKKDSQKPATVIVPLSAFGYDGDAREVRTAIDSQAFYLSRSPFRLLEDLKTLHELNPGLNGRIRLPILDRPGIQRWLTDERLRELIKLARDETPCLQAVNMLSSTSIDGPSTVGQEALKMIHATLSGTYPVTARNLKPDQIEAELDSYLSTKKDSQE